MIIDFHTHVFPDKIAEKTIAYLSKKGGIPAFSDGSVSGILCRMEEANVDLCINLPVLTSPAQFDHVNQFAAEINQRFVNAKRRLLSFAGIHPQCENVEQKMKWIRENGFLGIKIHPDYQDTFINDEKYLRILQWARELDLIVVTHAGVDGGFREKPVRCPPSLALETIRKVPHSKLVLAHCGGNEMIEEVLDTLCGEDVYLDTAYVLRFVSPELFRKLLEKHGEDRILFASDSPWSSIANDVKIIRSFDLPKNTEEKLFCTNAKKLLRI